MRIDQIDLMFLYLGARNEGGFNETDIASSELNYLGVGRTLDKLAYLKENGLIYIKNGMFVITEQGKNYLWDKSTPLQTRILKLLQIKSFDEQDIAKHLIESEQVITNQVDELRKSGQIMFTTIKKETRIIKMCEITQEGISQLQDAANPEVRHLLDQILAKIHYANPDEQKTIIRKLKSILD